jgi:hypothetical protein
VTTPHCGIDDIVLRRFQSRLDIEEVRLSRREPVQ